MAVLVAYLRQEFGAVRLKNRFEPDALETITPEELQARIDTFGGNWFKERELRTYLSFVWDALQDHVIILLIVMASVTLVVEGFLVDHAHGEDEPSNWWMESAAIYLSVFTIVNFCAASDWKKERMFAELQKQLETSNKKVVLRNGEDLVVTDRDIVVGDIILFNAHNMSIIPADGIILSHKDAKVDESTLTGEPEPLTKDEDQPFMFSGTVCVSGSGRMLVVAVGEATVSGQIKMRIYTGEDDEEDEKSPLFTKLDTLAGQIGVVGTAVASLCFVIMLIKGQLFEPKDELKEITRYFTTAITILAVAVPEGLPLAVTLSLLFSSTQMYRLANLVKQLSSCETMGSATTICTDKTGTLTANRMTVRGLGMGKKVFHPDAQAVGQRIKADSEVAKGARELLSDCTCICSMDESGFTLNEKTGKPDFKGNPTECALLILARDLDVDYAEKRRTTEGRSQETLSVGKPRIFTSARKLMSWAVPHKGGYRIFAKGASEIVLERVTGILQPSGDVEPATELTKRWLTEEVVDRFAREAMRTLGLAYRDVPGTFDLEALSETVLNPDGSPAYASETELTLIGITGIEDPLREEVPPAIAQCYEAGIDVRMVTGDNLETAIAIARRANILNDELHFEIAKSGQKVLKPLRAMEGSEFRQRVYQKMADGELRFDQ
jgi:Ca2+ transporting ATPase